MKTFYLLSLFAFLFFNSEGQNFRLSSHCNDVVDFNLTVYPNPSSGMFTIKLPLSISGQGQVSIFDIMGHEVYSANVTLENQLVVDASSFANGIYFVRLKDEKGFYNNTLLKQ